MEPSFKVLNAPSKSHQTVKINYKIIIFFFAIFSIFILGISPDNAFASVKKHKLIKKVTIKPCTENKSDSSSEMLLFFEKTTGEKTQNYNQFSSVVKKNETVVEILKPYGLTHADIFQFAKISKKTFNLRQIKAGHSYSIITDKSPEKKAKYLIYERDEKKYIILPIDNSSTNIVVKTAETVSNNKKNIITKSSLKQSSKNNSNTDKKSITRAATKNNGDVRIRQVSGVIKTSLHKTATRMGLNKKLVNQLTSIFKNTPAISSIRKGDMLQVAFQEKYVNGKRVKTGVITAAIVTSRKKSYHAYRFTYNGKHGYYDENGNSLESSFLKAPLKYREISSGFSTRRFHPIKQIYKPHPGIDYAAPKGTPIKSVGDGIVICKDYSSSTGNHIRIKHPGVGISEYMHMSKFHPSIKINKKISKGDIIGYVGMTGYATGPHLDLRFMVNNKYVDYRKLTLPNGNPLPRKFRNIFLQQVALVNKQWNRTARRELSLKDSNSFMKTGYSIKNILSDIDIENDPS